MISGPGADDDHSSQWCILAKVRTRRSAGGLALGTGSKSFHSRARGDDNGVLFSRFLNYDLRLKLMPIGPACFIWPSFASEFRKASFERHPVVCLLAR